jgi:hypothetical protein
VAAKKDGQIPEWLDINIGDQVKHAKWGVGTVLFKSGAGDATKVIVVFPEEGQKKLMLKQAKMKKVGTAPKAEVAAKAKQLQKQIAPVAAPDEETIEEGDLAPPEEDVVAVPDEDEAGVFEDDDEEKFEKKDKFE